MALRPSSGAAPHRVPPLALSSSASTASWAGVLLVGTNHDQLEGR